MSHTAYRFTTPQPWDQQPGLWVITTLSALFSLLVFAGRWTIRRQFSGADATLIVAYTLAAASWTALYVGLSRGAGKAADHVGMAEYSSAGKAIFTSNAILVAAQGVASCSQIMHLREIVPTARQKRMCFLATAVCFGAFSIAIMCISVGCSPSNAMNTSTRASCHHGISRWVVAAILIIFQTAVPAVLPIHLFKVLQTPSSKKRSIIAAFLFPLLNLITMIFFLWSYISSLNAAPDGTGLVNPEISLQVLLGWSLICPTIPCIRPLAMRFTTGGAIVLAGETHNTGDAPSTTKSYADPQGLRKRCSHFSKGPRQQEQDELELNPKAPERPTSTVRTSDDNDGQGSIGSYIASQGGIHVSRRYEVLTEGFSNKPESKNKAFPAS